MTERKKRLIIFASVLVFVGLVAASVALFWPSQQECAGAGCGSGSQYCASQCCLGTTVVDIVTGCEIRSWGCASQWSLSNTFVCGGGCDGNYDQGACSATWISVPVYITSTCSRQDCSTVCGWQSYQSCSWKWVTHCYGHDCESGWEQVCTTYYSWVCHDVCTTVYYSCQVFWGYEQQVSVCSRVSNNATTNCCGSGPPPTNTPQPPPPATATSVPTPLPSRTAVPTAAPLAASLMPRFRSLLLMAPKLGLPAQTLNGMISGGTPSYNVTLYVMPPGGALVTCYLAPGGSSATSNTATWRVVFYPVHGVP